jgi:integrase
MVHTPILSNRLQCLQLKELPKYQRLTALGSITGSYGMQPVMTHFTLLFWQLLATVTAMRTRLNAAPITKCLVRGDVRWRVDVRINGKRVRRFFATKADADREARMHRDKPDEDQAWAAIPKNNRLQLMMLVNDAQDAGFSIADLVAQLKESKENGKLAPSPSIRTCVDELVAIKGGSNRRHRYVNGLRRALNSFATGREAMPINAVTTQHVEQFLSRWSKQPPTQVYVIARLRVLFNWAVRRKYRTDNPCDGVEKPKIDEKPPVIFTVDEARHVMQTAATHTPECIAYFTLCIFAGVRGPEEVKLLTWANVDLDRGLLWMNAENSKVRRRRLVHLSPNAVEWLKHARSSAPHALVPTPHILRYEFEKVRTVSGVKWVNHIMRHTAASMMLARDCDAAKVALELGNSPTILLKHYRELVTREDAERFWSIGPGEGLMTSTHHHGVDIVRPSFA